MDRVVAYVPPVRLATGYAREIRRRCARDGLALVQVTPDPAAARRMLDHDLVRYVVVARLDHGRPVFPELLVVEPARHAALGLLVTGGGVATAIAAAVALRPRPAVAAALVAGGVFGAGSVLGAPALFGPGGPAGPGGGELAQPPAVAVAPAPPDRYPRQVPAEPEPGRTPEAAQPVAADGGRGGEQPQSELLPPVPATTAPSPSPEPVPAAPTPAPSPVPLLLPEEPDPLPLELCADVILLRLDTCVRV